MIKKAYVFIFGILFCLLFIVNLLIAESFTDNIKGESVCFTDRVLSAKQITGIYSEDEVPFYTLWNKDTNVNIKGNLHLNSYKTDLFTICGDSRNIFPDALINGDYLESGDYKGCLISESASEFLYNTDNAVGLTVALENRDYIVRGTLNSSIDGIVLIDDGKDTAFQNIENTDTEKDATMSAYGVDYYRTDYKSITQVCVFLSVIPFIIIAVYFVSFSIKNRKIFSQNTVKSHILAYGCILLCIIISFTLLKPLPEYLIPSMWSDFDFFSEEFKSTAEFIKNFVYNIDTYKQYKAFVFMCSSAVITVAELVMSVCFIVSFNKLCKEKIDIR